MLFFLLFVRRVALRVRLRLVHCVGARRVPCQELVHWIYNVQIWKVVWLVGVVLVITGRHLGTQSVIRHYHNLVVGVFGTVIDSLLNHEESGLKQTARHINCR